MSAIVILVGLIMLSFGLTMLPRFGLFGIVWLLVGVVIIAMHVLNLVGIGFPAYEIDVDSDISDFDNDFDLDFDDQEIND
jgi:hypothetical protein